MEDLKSGGKKWVSQSSGGNEGTRIDDSYGDESDQSISTPRVLEKSDPQYSQLLHRRNSFPFDKPSIADKVRDQAFFIEMTKIRRAIEEEF